MFVSWVALRRLPPPYYTAYSRILSWTVEKVMILRENRPLFRSRENSSHIYSPFPPCRRRPRPSVGSGRFPSSSCALPPSLSLGGGSRNIWRMGDEGGEEGAVAPRDENLNLASVGRWVGRSRSSQPIAFDYGMYVAPHYPLLDGLKVDAGGRATVL